MGQVVCVGSLVADLVAHPVRALPEAGRQALVDSIRLLPGGSGANTATGLARLGVPVELVGRVGADVLGDFVLRALADQGVGLRSVQRDAGAGTSCTLVLVQPGGERRFIHQIGANAHLTAADVPASLIAEATWVHVAGALVLPGLDGEPLADLLRQAREAGAPTSLDIVWDDTGRWLEMLHPCLPFTDIFLPNLLEAQGLSGRQAPVEAAAALLQLGVGAVVLKLGAEGCLVMSQDGLQERIAGIPVEALDATGAGDAFAAGLLAALWRGWSLPDAARIANVTGAQCVGALGSTAGVRSWPETLALLAARADR